MDEKEWIRSIINYDPRLNQNGEHYRNTEKRADREQEIQMNSRERGGAVKDVI